MGNTSSGGTSGTMGLGGSTTGGTGALGGAAATGAQGGAGGLSGGAGNGGHGGLGRRPELRHRPIVVRDALRGSRERSGELRRVHHRVHGRKLVTWHHNWWSSNVHERMPRVRFGDVHVFDNYYSSSGNNYCIRAGFHSNVAGASFTRSKPKRRHAVPASHVLALETTTCVPSAR